MSDKLYFGSIGFRRWCESIDARIEEDFFAMLDVFVRNLRAGDSYATQLRDMGYCFEEGREKPARFIDCLAFLRAKSMQSSETAVFSPVKMFRRTRATPTEMEGEQREPKREVRQTLVFGAPRAQACDSDEEKSDDGDDDGDDDGGDDVNEKEEEQEEAENIVYVANLYTGQGIECFDDARLEKLNLLKPDTFVLLLANGFFPIGCPTRELTNQTLSAHDVAHLAGFVDQPQYAQQNAALVSTRQRVATDRIAATRIATRIATPHRSVARAIRFILFAPSVLSCRSFNRDSQRSVARTSFGTWR